ncbi:MAG: hypothetical protein J3Q66DRAFT_387998 [Benniella sp.]|nr:MAG: hypothetical protein J3Q66DRAFT_387998 [Benniella sp.]
MSNQKQGKSGGGGGGGGNSSGGVAGQHSGGMRAEAKKTKAVFKHVLETPFSIPWPEVTPENNTIVLDVLCDLIAPIREYHRNRCSSDSKQSTTKKSKKSKKSKGKDASKDEGGSSRPNTALATVDMDPSSASKEASIASTSQRPSVLDFTIIGINAITKSLERSIQDLITHPPPSAVFLCKGDLVPAHLYTHLGPMIAMLPGTVVFPLLKGSEQKLSEALGMPAVGALAIKARTGQKDTADVQCKEADDLIMILERMVEPINVSWLPKVKPPPPPTTGPKRKRKAQQSKATLDATTTSVTTAVTTLTVSDDHSAAVSAASSTVVSVAAAPEVPSTVASTSTSDGSDTRTKQMSGSVSWIPTNIKAVRKDQTQHQGQGKSSGKNKDQQQQSKQQQSKQQQPKQQQPKQQQPKQQQPKQQQPKQNKQQQQPKQQQKQQQKEQQQQQQQSKNPAQGKKHRAEESAQDRRQDKRPKME